MVSILLLAMIQGAQTPPPPPMPARSASMAVRARVVQTCVLSTSGPTCAGSRDAPPQVTREPGRVTYAF